MPDDLPTAPRAALSAAQDLLDAGLYFQAHEVLERAWRTAPAAERGLWRALTQIVVGLVHAARGNTRGATALLRRGLTGLAPYLPDPTTDAGPAGADPDPAGARQEAAGCADGGRRPAPDSRRTHGVNLTGVARWAEDLLARLEKPGPQAGGVPPPPRLLAPGRD
ncbi:DUF309 domain-containing protein [Parafrankia discariae]|uniref:DUF309 domain-containing protein n=1 Tax=Parafrankia discariae TaxID=365528 RepID=UPI00039B89FE|nr:DUF309 domain-containing protein [Parafrankia discariae]